MKPLLGLALIALAGPALGQTPATAVTLDEARATALRAQSLLGRMLNVSLTQPSPLPAGTAPVTRAQVVAEMTRLFALVRPNFKMTPRAVSYDATRLVMADPKAMANLRTLIAYGCVARVGPLATGPGETLTPAQFGDAMGLFLTRLAQLTHLPSPKWTPALGAGS